MINPPLCIKFNTLHACTLPHTHTHTHTPPQELARQEEEEKRARLKHHLSLHRQYLSDRAKQHYQKNYQLCHQIILQLVDFATKMAEYREVTQG